LKCPVCKSEVVFDNGIFVCPSCGTVVDEHPVSQHALYGEPQKILANAITLRMHDLGLGKSHLVDSNARGKRGLVKALRMLNEQLRALGARSKCVKEASALLLRHAISKQNELRRLGRRNRLQVRRLADLVPACVYVAHEVCGLVPPRGLSVSKSLVLRLQALAKAVGLKPKLGFADLVASYAEQAVRRLGLGEEVVAEVARIARELPHLQRFTPRTATAGALVAVATARGMHLTLEAALRALGASGYRYSASKARDLVLKYLQALQREKHN
jgi:transcription initiation factor TFIIIB Brf1 subunit/transcription initiation factor TFIIB